MSRNSWIDIIRAFAAFSVLLTHIGNVYSETMIGHSLVKILRFLHDNLVWVNEGLHSGVIIFIVLSGFCIHTSAINIKKSNFKKIYTIRRFFRIFPLLLFSISFGYLAYGLTNDFSWVIVKNFIFNIFLLHSIVPSIGPLGNEILGTVIVECMLYILYPFIILHLRGRWVVLFIFLLALHILSFLTLLLGFDPVWVERNVFTVLIYWWIGVFVAELYVNSPYRIWNKYNDNVSIKYKIFIGFCFYIFYILMCNYIEFKGSHIIKSFLLVILIAYILTWILQLKSRSNLFMRSFEKLGLISYSVYVLQLPIIILTQYFISTDKYFLIYSCLFTILFSILCFVVIEKPSHDYGKKLSKRYF